MYLDCIMKKEERCKCQSNRNKSTHIHDAMASSSKWSLTLIWGKLHVFKTHVKWKLNKHSERKIFFRWFVFNQVTVFFVIVYCIIATTKAKSWTEQSFSIYFFIYIKMYCYCSLCVFVSVTEKMHYLYLCDVDKINSYREKVCVCVCATFDRFCCFWTSCFLIWSGLLQSSCVNCSK